MTPRRPASPELVTSPHVEALTSLVEREPKIVDVSMPDEDGIERTLPSRVFDPTEATAHDAPGGRLGRRSYVESPYVICASSDGLRAASYYTHARPIAGRFDTLPPVSPARVEVAIDPPYQTKTLPYLGPPPDATPPPTLVDTSPIAERGHGTASAHGRVGRAVLIAIGGGAMAVMFLLSLMTWLSRPPRGRSAAASRAFDTGEILSAAPSTWPAVPSTALPSAFPSAGRAHRPLPGR